ncbi:putative armadillo-like helical, tetratricopeptide-like helical domain superfamily [Dioscorea sansibarensis]
MEQQNPRRRRAALTTFFNTMPYTVDESQVLVMSSLWSMAMTNPTNPELPFSGALHCMSLLINKSLSQPSWLLLHQNVYIPYYAAHIIGSYTIKSSSLAELAVDAGAVPLLLDLLRGRLSWVEQRVAARALGHLASYDSTFHAVALHGEEVINLAMKISTSCLKTVYTNFIMSEDRKKYHCDLLTRGLGGKEMEDRKAEEWASQLQCWSLYLLSCFAFKDKGCHYLICRELGFLRELCRMWGGMVNGESPAGVGLMRILCRSSVGREAMAGCPEVVLSLCNLSRSSDDWQYMGIDCLVLLLKDSKTRLKVMSIALDCLVDLVELKNLGTRYNVGSTITKVLLMDYDEEDEDHDKINSISYRLWELKVERKRREEMMVEEELVKRWSLGEAKKKEGNERFYSGEIEEALVLYTQALELCPLKSRKERMVLYSNRAQCCLLLQDADGAVSDATRALCLSSPANSHCKSLWRRSQAYDMKGMAKESLMDCIMFVNLLVGENREKKKGKVIKVPYYAARMINKQMNAVGLFAGVVSGEGDDGINLQTIEEEEEKEEEEEEGRRRRRWIKEG